MKSEASLTKLKIRVMQNAMIFFPNFNRFVDDLLIEVANRRNEQIRWTVIASHCVIDSAKILIWLCQIILDLPVK